MKILNKFLFPVLLFAGILTFQACNIEELDDPNGASIDGVIKDASKSELQILVTGTESLLRKEVVYYYDVTSIIGRDYWFFTNSDPRYTGELLGKNASVLDNRGFYGTRPYAGRYKTVKNTNILIEATRNSKADLSDADKKGYYGFAKTIQAYELLLALNLQYTNGIRVNVSDQNNLGAFVSYDAALTAIQDLLTEARSDLSGAGNAFTFVLSSGFDGFNTPASLMMFNQAIAARVAMYQGDKTAVIDHLSNSFMDANADFYKGVYRTYSTAGGEVVNPLFRTPDQSEALIAHPDWVSNLESSDDRSSKATLRSAPLTLDDLTGDHDVTIYTSRSDKVALIRNEELILLSAEANIGTNNSVAKDMLNVIRNGHGLISFTGSTDAELMDELVQQRRYSLFAEGHRWVDMRRWGRLSEIPKDRTDDDVWEMFPRPGSEN